MPTAPALTQRSSSRYELGSFVERQEGGEEGGNVGGGGSKALLLSYPYAYANMSSCMDRRQGPPFLLATYHSHSGWGEHGVLISIGAASIKRVV